jgi:hypothetical protein
MISVAENSNKSLKKPGFGRKKSVEDVDESNTWPNGEEHWKGKPFVINYLALKLDKTYFLPKKI